MANPWDSDRLPPAIAALRAYDPGHDLVAWRRRFPKGLVELGSNESPLGPSPKAMAAAQAALACAHRYPDPLGGDLKRALAQRHSVDIAQIVLGNGSHELLMLIAQAFAPVGTPIVFSQYGFAVFAIAAAAVDARAVTVPALPADHPLMPFGHDMRALSAACDESTRILYLANPNNPTGTWFERAALEQLLAEAPRSTLVVVDEAYQEYQPEPDTSSALRLLGRYPNLVVTRTFSKAYALAGLRIGYAIGTPDAIAVLERVRESFNVNAPAQAAARTALDDRRHVEAGIAFTTTQRTWAAKRLQALGVPTLPSRTNFLLADFGTEARASAIESRLCEEAVIVRPMRGYGLPHCLRVSLGMADENERFLRIVEALS